MEWFNVFLTVTLLLTQLHDCPSNKPFLLITYTLKKKSFSFLFIPPVKGLKQISIGMLGRKASKSTKKTAAAKFSIGRIFFPVFL